MPTKQEVQQEDLVANASITMNLDRIADIAVRGGGRGVVCILGLENQKNLERAEMGEGSIRFIPAADFPPLPDREAAWLASYDPKTQVIVLLPGHHAVLHSYLIGFPSEGAKALARSIREQVTTRHHGKTPDPTTGAAPYKP